MIEDIERLLLEAQRSRFTERRTEPRHAFVRPVKVYLKDQPPFQAIAKDLSKQGIGILTDRELPQQTVAVLTIHSTSQFPVHVKCELRWSDKFGKGWFLTGWKFIGSAAPPVD